MTEKTATEATGPAYTALRAQLHAELDKTNGCLAQPVGPGGEEARLVQDGIAAGLRLSLAWAIHHFEGPEVRDAFLGGEAGR